MCTAGSAYGLRRSACLFLGLLGFRALALSPSVVSGSGLLGSGIVRGPGLWASCFLRPFCAAAFPILCMPLLVIRAPTSTVAASAAYFPSAQFRLARSIRYSDGCGVASSILGTISSANTSVPGSDAFNFDNGNDALTHDGPKGTTWLVWCGKLA